MTEADQIHSCGYHCTIPACIKAQRDQLVKELEALRADAAKSERRAQAFGGIITNQVIAMQAAVIDSELNDSKGMAWIANTLIGPGHYPDLDAARAMGGAQAWFDAKTTEEEARLASITLEQP